MKELIVRLLVAISWGIILLLIIYGSKAKATTLIPYKVPPYFLPKYESTWNSLGDYILKTKFKTYTLNMKGKGGNSNMMYKFASVLTQARKQGKIIIFNLTGNVASAQSDITCYATYTQTNGYTRMFHAGYQIDLYGNYIKNSEGAAYSFQYPALQQCYQAGVITKQELDIIRTRTIYK